MGGYPTPPIGDSSSFCVPQYDGNISLMSECSSESVSSNYNNDAQLIPTVLNHFSTYDDQVPPPWFEPYFSRNKIPPVRKTIYRNNKILDSLSLPTISVSNMRSLMPKIKNFKNDILEREISLAILSEVWEKKGNKKHKFQIEKMLQEEGLKYISTLRPSSKRGGGCAIVAYLPYFSLEKIEVTVPRSVEVCYGLLRSKNATAKYKEIIAVSFYSPPKSKKRTELLDNIITNSHVLMMKYPNAVLVIGGDRNEMSISP